MGLCRDYLGIVDNGSYYLGFRVFGLSKNQGPFKSGYVGIM